MCSFLRIVLKFLGSSFFWGVLLLVTAWGFGAIWFDFPLGMYHAIAWGYLVVVLMLLMFVKPRWVGKLGSLLLIGVIVACWLTRQPSNKRDWQADVFREPWAEIEGDQVTIHEVRNFDYQKNRDAIPHWESRTVSLSQLIGIDLAINYWGSPWIAHPIVSFQFTDAPPVAMSIETRREKGEGYSALGGLYRQFELIYIVADERDLLRKRVQNGEEIYLYRTSFSRAEARARFLEYISMINSLHDKPRWYNALTTNCTTAIRSQRTDGKRMPWDWRILVNGKMDKMLYERGILLSDGLSFDQLKEKALMNSVAQTADPSPDFSKLIRVGRPGFGAVAK